MKKSLKYTIAVVLAVVTAVLLEFGTSQNMPMPKTWALPQETVSTISMKDVSLVGYEVKNQNEYVRTAEDPQMHYVAPEGVQGVKITLAEPAQSGFTGVLYFANEPNTFAEHKSVPFTFSLGETEKYIPLSAPKTFLRLDMDGDFRLASIQTSVEPLIGTPEAPNFSVFRCGVLFLACVCLFGLFVYFEADQKVKKWFTLKNLKRAAAYIGISVLCCAVFTGLLYLACHIVHHEFGPKLILFASAFGVCASTMLFFRTQIGKKPEVMFLAAALTISVVLSSMFSVSALVSWDTESHYRYALDMSFIGNVYYTEADQQILQMKITENSFNTDFVEDIESECNRMYENGAVAVKGLRPLRLKHIGNLPNTIGLFLGRAFGFSFSNILRLGRLCNGIAYALLMYFAIKKLRYGKMVLSCIGLFPMTLFLASNYSYDPFVIACTALGFSYFLAEYQTPHKPIEMSNIWGMVIFMTIGCASKAIYFFLFLIMFLMPKEKFQSKKMYQKYILGILGGMAILAMSFVVPYLLIHPAASGDTRGGSDVNGLQQIIYILTHPFNYARTLIEFLIGYLSIETASQYTGNYAYLGTIPISLILIAILAVVTFTDESPNHPVKYGVWKKIYAYFIAFVTVCLVATVLYIDFTPVGSNYIAGCQPRYIVPILFPLLSFVYFQNAEYKINRNYYNAAVFGAYILFNYYTMWQLVLRYYG